jgi:hypothetical protein
LYGCPCILCCICYKFIYVINKIHSSGVNWRLQKYDLFKHFKMVVDKYGNCVTFNECIFFLFGWQQIYDFTLVAGCRQIFSVMLFVLFSPNRLEILNMSVGKIT